MAADPVVLRPSTHEVLERIREQGLPVECEVCDARFANQQHLEMHMRKHGWMGVDPHNSNELRDAKARRGRNSLPVICPECFAHFGSMPQLLKHYMRKHTDERPFVCAKCDAAFKASCTSRIAGPHAARNLQLRC